MAISIAEMNVTNTDVPEERLFVIGRYGSTFNIATVDRRYINYAGNLNSYLAEK
jgi:hypothetical protein